MRQKRLITLEQTYKAFFMSHWRDHLDSANVLKTSELVVSAMEELEPELVDGPDDNPQFKDHDAWDWAADFTTWLEEQELVNK
jgi:hypothetical protein